MTVRRLKTYTAQTGYVYEYYFVGKRPALARRSARSRDRIHIRHQLRPQDNLRRKRVSSSASVEAYTANHGRTLSEPEQYAAVKMRLLQGPRRNRRHAPATAAG